MKFEFALGIILEEALEIDPEDKEEGEDKADGGFGVLDLIVELRLACISSRTAQETYLG